MHRYDITVYKCHSVFIVEYSLALLCYSDCGTEVSDCCVLVTGLVLGQ